MRTFRLGDAASLGAGVLNGCQLDNLFDAANGNPAIVPSPDWAAAGWVPETDSRWAYTGTWSSGATTTPGDSATFTFVGYGVALLLASGGGIAWLTIDGAPYLACDTYAPGGPHLLVPWLFGGAVSLAIATPTGGQHVVGITYYGDIAATLNPIGAVTNTVGTSVGALLHPVRANRGGTTAGTQTIVALNSGHVSINGSGSYAVGTTVTGVIPGVNLGIAGGTLTTGDTATFTTQATGLTVLGAYVATTEQAGATWTAPVLSNLGELPATGATVPLAEQGVPNVPLQWLALTWEEDPANPVHTGTAATGNTLNPADAAWSLTPASDAWQPSQLAIAHDGLGHGHMGLAVLPAGCYVQPSLVIPAGGYLRNPRLYGWDPDTDPDRRRFPPVPDDDLARRLYGGLAAGQAIVERDPMRELLASCAISTAVGAYLDQHGAEWQVPRPFGLPDQSYATLLRFFSSARTQGGTLAFFQQALALLLGPGVPYTVQSLAGTTTGWVLGTSRLGVDTALGSFTPQAWQALVSITVRALAIPPQTVQNIVSLFTPIGVSVQWLWQ